MLRFQEVDVGQAVQGTCLLWVWRGGAGVPPTAQVSGLSSFMGGAAIHGDRQPGGLHGVQFGGPVLDWIN